MTRFICMYPNHWGIGETATEARKNARKLGGRGNVWIVKEFPVPVEDVEVNGFGDVKWRWPDGSAPDAWRGYLPVVEKGKGVKI